MILRSNQLNSSLPNSFWKNKSKDEDFICDVKKNPNLKKLIRYDGNFNNKRKVEFESVVAGILRTNPAKIKKLVNHVSRLIWPEIEDAFLRSNNSWLCQHMIDVFYEKDNIKTLFLIDSKDIVDVSNIQDNFYKWMRTILNSKSDQDVYKQLEIINRYAHFFLKPFEHMAKFKKLNNKLDIETVPDGVGKTENKINMRLLWKKYRGNNWPHSGSQERSRIDISAKAKKSSSFGIFSPGSEANASIKKFIPHIHPHFQGMSAWRVVHTSYFAKEARYDLDMPLIASQSDSIALLLIPAIVIGKLTDDDLMVYNLGAISFLVGDGHHSIHEFKPVWNAFNIPYVDSNYASIFPDGFIQAHPELLELQKHFPDLLSLKSSDQSQVNLFK